MHLCIHTCMHIHKCMHIQKCMHAYTQMHIHKYIHACMHAYMYIVVNFNAVAQASNIRIGRRQVVFLCWMRDSVHRPCTCQVSEAAVEWCFTNSHGSWWNIIQQPLHSLGRCKAYDSVFGTESPADWMPADKPTELSRIKLKTWTRQPVPMISKHSAHSTPLPVGFRTWLWQYTRFFLFISMVWHRQAIMESKAGELSSSVQCCSMIGTRVFGTDWMAADKPTELSRIKLKSMTF